MKLNLRRCFAAILSVVMLLSISLTVYAEEKDNVTVLFTHDLHSHLLPSADEDGGEFGGYARLMTVIKE